MKIRKRSITSSIYTIVSISSVVLSMYGVSQTYHTFTLREVLMILVIFLCILESARSGRIVFRLGNNATIGMFILFVVIVSMLGNTLEGNEGFYLRVIRYLVVLIFVFSLAKDYFDPVFGLKLYKYCVVFASLFLLAQVVCANSFNYMLKGYISWLPLRFSGLAYVNGLKRFYSIFEEPGYYGMFASGYLCIALFSDSFSWSTVFLIALASFFSTSTTAIVSFVFVVLIYILYHNKHAKSTLDKVDLKLKKYKGAKTLLVILGIGAFAVFYNTRQFQDVLYRLQYTGSTSDRFMGYQTLASSFSALSIPQLLYGNCMSFYSISGYAALLMSFGIVGTVLLLAAICQSFRQTNNVGKALVVLFLFLNIGNVEFFGNASTIIVYFSFVLSLKAQNAIPRTAIIPSYIKDERG